MTFSGKSYAKWVLQHSTKKRYTLKLRIRTRQNTATLMYAKGKVDYSILKVKQFYFCLIYFKLKEICHRLVYDLYWFIKINISFTSSITNF